MKTVGIIVFFGTLFGLASMLSNQDGRYDRELQAEYRNWVKVMESHDIDVSKSENLQVLDFKNMSDDIAGETNIFSDLIYVNEDMREHKATVKAIIWHELGHYTFDLKHGECDLMNAERFEHDYYKQNWRVLRAEYIETILNKVNED